MPTYRPHQAIYEPANIVYSGHGLPPFNVGDQNDWWMDRDTGDIYVRDGDLSAEDGGWNLKGSIAGSGGGGAASGHITGAGAPTNGVAGTGIGTVKKGWLYTDETNGIVYLNQGSDVNVQWVAVLGP